LLGTASCYHGLDVAPPQLATVLVVVVAAVGDGTIGALAGPATAAGHRADAVDERQQLGDVVAVGAGEGDRERDAARVARLRSPWSGGKMGSASP
jgi:hypothetical protein